MEDVRIRRSKKLLLEAMFDLMQTQPFDKISVCDICDKAMVHRATFYNHFKDKNDLLNYGLDELQERMYEAAVKDGDGDEREMYLKLASNMYDFMHKNRKEFLLILKNGSEKLFKIGHDTFQRSVRYLVGRHKEKHAVPTDLVVNFLAGGFVTVGISQLSAEKPCSKEEFMAFFEKLLDKRLFEESEQG